MLKKQNGLVLWPCLYFLVRPLLDFVYPRVLDPELTRVNEYLLQRQSLFCFLAVFLSLWIISKKISAHHWGSFACGAVLLNSVLSFFGYGVLGNPAQDACFIALGLPIIWRYLPAWISVIPIAAIVYAGSATAFLVLSAIGIVAISFHLIPVIALFAIGLLQSRPDFWHANGRLEYWKQAIHFAWEKDFVFGVGPGSYFLYGPAHWLKQGMNSVPAWLHNDFVETFFGYGLLGVFFLGMLIGFAIWCSKDDKITLAVLIGFLIAMNFQMPLQQPLFYLYLFYISAVVAPKRIFISDEEQTS